MGEVNANGAHEKASIRATRQSRRKETLIAARIRYAMERINGSHMSITSPIIWLNCFDARFVHWLHSYRRPIVVAGESRCRYRSAVVRFCERSHGVVSEANERFHVRITLAKRVDAVS